MTFKLFLFIGLITIYSALSEKNFYYDKEIKRPKYSEIQNQFLSLFSQYANMLENQGLNNDNKNLPNQRQKTNVVPEREKTLKPNSICLWKICSHPLRSKGTSKQPKRKTTPYKWRFRLIG